jgi:predicted secreted hydrolase
MRRILAIAMVAALVASACSGPILANRPIVFPTTEPPSPAPSAPHDPVPITFPRDDGPHDRLTEWWYYTGHLRTDSGRRFGFEAVVFRAERGAVPASWAAHLALTDEAGGQFHYAQRSEIGLQVDHSRRSAGGDPSGFDLQVAGLNPTLIAAGVAPLAPAWRLSGSGGRDHIEAALTKDEAALAGASFALQLDLATTKPPALHGGAGFIDFGPAGSSYYYSRTRLAASGTLLLDGVPMAVDGIAWFDHQWGDFVSVGGGGWDWFAVNLDDDVDITASIVLDERANTVLAYATVVGPDGATQHVQQEVASARTAWQSPRTGTTYPIDWSMVVGDYVLDLAPTVLDQELDTRATTGVAYWEGSQKVSGTKAGAPIRGDAYVEITRYSR